MRGMQVEILEGKPRYEKVLGICPQALTFLMHFK
jgi:hypothetical protein